MNQRILTYGIIFLLVGLAFALIVPSIDWHGTPKLEGLATKSANDFHIKLFAEEYQKIYDEADGELRNKTTANYFQDSLKTIKSKLRNSIISEQTKCIGTGANSMWDRIKLTTGSSAKITADCIMHTGGESFVGRFVWRYINAELN